MNQAWKIAGYLPRHWPFRGHDNDAVHRSDFVSVDPLADRPTPDETSAKVREVVSALKGACVALALIPSLALCRTVGPDVIPPDAKMGEVHPDTPVTNLVAQAGGGGSLPDNAVVLSGGRLVESGSGTNLTAGAVGAYAVTDGFTIDSVPLSDLTRPRVTVYDTEVPTGENPYTTYLSPYGMEIYMNDPDDRTPSQSVSLTAAPTGSGLVIIYYNSDGTGGPFFNLNEGGIIYEDGTVSGDSSFALAWPNGKFGTIAVESWSSLSAMLSDAETNNPAPANGPLMAKRLGAAPETPKAEIARKIAAIAKPEIAKIAAEAGGVVRSETAGYYRTGKPGELGTGWVYTALDGTMNMRFAAYVPALAATVSFSGAPDDPILAKYGASFSGSGLTRELSAISSPEGERGKYDLVEYGYSFTNGLPVHLTVRKNLLNPSPAIVSVSTDYATLEFEDSSDPSRTVWHYCHSFFSSGTTVSYVDSWNDSSGDYGNEDHSFQVSVSGDGAVGHELSKFGGFALTTDENKGDSISVLTERTGRPGEAGSGWGYKVYEFQTDRRSWNVKVPTLNASGASTDYTTVTEGMPNAIPVYRDPFAAVDAATACTMADREVVSTEGKYSTDACSNATYTASVTLLGKKLSLEVSDVSVDGRPPVVKIIPTSQWASVPYVPPSGQGSGDGMIQGYYAEALNVSSSRRASKSVVIKDSYNRDVTISSWQTVYGGVMMTIPVDPATGNVITETQGGSVKIPVGWKITRSLTAHATYFDSYGYSRTYDANGTARPSGTNYVTVSASPALSQFSVEGYELVNDKNKFEITDEVTGAKMVIRLRDGSLYLDPKED